jgi:uncharacterized phage protein gp47/JayE
MPLSLPALSDLRAQFRGNFAARVPGFDQTLRRSVTGVFSDMLAGAVYLCCRALGWVSRQLFFDSAEAPYLDRKAADYGIVRAAAVLAGGNCIFTGTATTPIPAGTTVQTTDQTLQFTTQAAGTIATGGTVSVPIVCTTAGAAGNLAAGAVLNLVSAISGVQPQAAVDGNGLSGGTDAQSDASLRSQSLARIQEPPQGGAATDFWQWAKNSGIPTRAWVFPLNRGAGSCDVTFTIDTRVNPVPLAADLAAVQSYIAALSPVIGSYQVFAPTADALAITIRGLNPGDTATKAAVQAALMALVATVPPGGASCGDGITQPVQTGALFPTQVPGMLYLSMIQAAIDSAADIQSYDLVAPSADVAFAAGHLPAPPVVTFE